MAGTRWRRWLARALAGLLLALGALAGTAATLLLASLPRHDGAVVVKGLAAPVTIHRDAWAIPHVTASTEADGYFALGWVHAQDRLWQLEYRRRLVEGRLAELVGAPALPADRFLRLMRFAELAEASLAHLSPESRALVDAYVAGINAFLHANRRPLPPEFWLSWHRPRPWTAADAIGWVKLMALDLAQDWQEELLRARLARRLPPELLDDLFPDATGWQDADLGAVDLDALAAALPPANPSGRGSNAWLVDGRHSRSGAPLLANDPHLALGLPGPWYLAGLHLPGTSVVGATLPGLPVFVLGRTDRIAWGMTNTGSDVQDLVIEEVDAFGSRTPDGTAPLAVDAVELGCRFCPDETLVRRWSINGPLVSDLVRSAAEVAGPERALALRWTALAADAMPLEAGFALVRARNVAEVEAALAHFADPQQNVFFADVEGRIGFIAAGRVPVRRGHDGRLPRAGWEAATAWEGFVPFAALPRVRDPETGWLANANERPVDASYPFHLGTRWDDHFRKQRIVEFLSGGPHDLAGFRRMQLDARSGLATALLPAMLDLRTARPDVVAWRDRLAAWDRTADTDRAEPTVFAAWYDALAEALYADELGALFPAYRGRRAGFVHRALTSRPGWCDDVGTAEVEDCPTILGAALAAALDRLGSSLGPEGPAWAWGRQHPVVLHHEPFGRIPVLGRLLTRRFEVAGDATALLAFDARRAAAPPLFPSGHGPSYRQLIDLADPQGGRFVAATGQVGHPASRHHADLTRLWVEGGDVPMAPPATPSATLQLLPAPERP